MSGLGCGAAREPDDVADQRGQLVELVQDVAAQTLVLLGGQARGFLEHLDVGAQRRDRSTQLVAGVGDQLPLDTDGARERVERRVKALGESRELVATGDLESLGEVEVARETLGALSEAARSERERCAR